MQNNILEEPNYSNFRVEVSQRKLLIPFLGYKNLKENCCLYLQGKRVSQETAAYIFSVKQSHKKLLPISSE
jgi:hypothetical protein